MPALVQVVVFVILLAIITRYLGAYMAQVFEGERNLLSPVLAPVENGIYRLLAHQPAARADLAGLYLGHARLQRGGPAADLCAAAHAAMAAAQPAGPGAASPDSSFNTAASFTTNTNWQSYVPETTVSYLTNMAGLAVHNFTSAARRHRAGDRADPRLRPPRDARPGQLLGRPGALHALYPAAPVAGRRALVYVSQGVIQNFNAYQTVHTLQGGRADHRRRAGRLPGGDQRAGHQRRWHRSTRTAPTRSRTPTASPISSRC